MRHLLVLTLLAVAPAVAAADVTVTRDHVTGDVYHYGFTIDVGASPNAKLRVHRVVRERAPWVPRATVAGTMMLHGDFATFITNFAPSLGNPPSPETGVATYLAQRGIDVWGVDRRWTTTPVDGDVSDFGEMGFAQELDDIGHALALARALRLATGSGGDKLTLAGFSRGGQLAYAYAAGEAARPAILRHVKTLVPLDVYAVMPPELEDIRTQVFCPGSQFEYELVAGGFIDSDNFFIIDLGNLALTAPDDPSPNPAFTNRQRMLRFLTETFNAFPATPTYQLAAGSVAAGLSQTDETVAADWLAAAPPHQALFESADGDALWCGDGPLPVPYDIASIRVPLFYLGAENGFGTAGLHTTTLVASREVRTVVVPGFAHADLLFADGARDLAWKPLAAWILDHR